MIGLATDAALGQARSLLGSAAAPTVAGADDPLALAWALKALCYEAWSTEPPRAVRAAEALRALLSTDLPAAQRVEIAALADWTGGLAAVIGGQMAEAVRLFDSAAAGLRSAGQPDPAAQTQVPKIMALSMLGQHEQAAACAVAAQRELRALGNLGVAARVSQNLGALQFRRDAYADAARHYREAGVLFARLRDPAHSVLADIGLADALTATGDFDEALRIYARARMRAGQRGLGLQLAMVDESMALLDLACGRYREALAGLASARSRYQALAVPHCLAIAEKQLADAYLELRLLPEAQALFDTAVRRFGELAMPDEAAWALAQRARTEALLGQAADAAQSLVEASALFDRQGNAVGSASVALAQAELSLAGGQAGEALAHAEQARRGFDAAGQADGQARAEVLCAQAQWLAGQRAEAQRGFEAALARAKHLQQWPVQQRCLTGLGLAALARGEPQAASAHFEAAIESFEARRRALPGDEIRSAFLTDHLRPYQEQLRGALAGGDGAQVLWQLERFRARALDDHRPDLADSAADDDTMALRDRLNWLYRRVQRLQDEGSPTSVPDEELRRTERELLERARRRRLQAAADPQNPGPGRPAAFSLAALQLALAPGDALVEYGVLDDELLACVLTQGRITLHRRLAPWSVVAEAVRATLFQLETLRHGEAPVRQHLPMLTARAQARLQGLHELVWAPLVPALAGIRRLLVVPHAQLGALPWAALTDGRQALAERFEIALAPSARAALRGLQRPPAAARRVLALGESSRLPQAAVEAQAVAGLFTQGMAGIGAAATLELLRQQAGQADVLHLACHAQFRADNPRFSALHLHDGLLTADQVESLALRPCTVVLSACETGLTDTGTGDERIGLVRAFGVAGAARVLASLWPVDDTVTAGFMASFYRALTAGAAPAAALRQAQLATRQAHAHPYFWAAFALYDGW